MPPLPFVPGVIKLRLKGVAADTIWENIFYVSYTGTPPNETSLLNFLSAVVSYFGTFYEAEAGTNSVFEYCDATDLSSDVGAFASLTTTKTGTRTGDFPPASASVLVSMPIARRYRGGHPRHYLSIGTAGTYLAGSAKFWDTAFLADVLSKWTTMMNDLFPYTGGATTYVNFCNVSYYSAKERRAVAQVDPIVSFVFEERVCSQRRRLGKVGG